MFIVLAFLPQGFSLVFAPVFQGQSGMVILINSNFTGLFYTLIDAQTVKLISWGTPTGKRIFVSSLFTCAETLVLIAQDAVWFVFAVSEALIMIFWDHFFFQEQILISHKIRALHARFNIIDADVYGTTQKSGFLDALILVSCLLEKIVDYSCA